MIKLYTLVLCALCLAGTALAQSPAKSLFIKISYQGSESHVEQAIETIEAISTVDVATIVGYEAGRSVILLPGFEAKNGSTFVAQIKATEMKLAGTVEEPRLGLAAFPNPFEQSTSINYYLPTDGKVNLWITDSQGKIVRQLLKDENQSAGQHRIEWKTDSLNDGVYIPVIESNQQRAVLRIVKK